MADEVEFNIDTNAAKVTKEIKQLSKAQESLIEETKRLDRAERGLASQEKALERNIKARARAMNKANQESRLGARVARGGRAVGGALSSGAVIGGAVAAGAAALAVSKGIRESSAEALGFADSMTALLSLGNNAKNFKQIRAQVEELSITSGKSVAEIANGMFTLQSATSNLSQAIRDDLLRESIELSKANGTQLEPTLNALTTVFQIYGKEVKNVADLQNKLQLAQQRGKLTFDDLARFMPEVSAAAQAMGFSLNEVNAALTVATIKGGRSETTFTGLRNVFLRIHDAEKKGISLTGTFAEKLEQLSRVDPNTLKELFGAESIAVINNLVKGVAQFNRELEITKNVQGDIAGDTIKNRLENDPFFAVSERLNQKRQTIAALKRDPKMAEIATKFEAQLDVFALEAARLATDPTAILRSIMAITPVGFSLEGAGVDVSGQSVGDRFAQLDKKTQRAGLISRGESALATPSRSDDFQAAQAIAGSDVPMNARLANVLERLEASMNHVAVQSSDTANANSDVMRTQL